MLYESLEGIYKKFRLMHYRSLFSRIREKEGSLSATEAFSVEVIYLLNKPTIKQFSDFLGISQPNATYKINSLIEKGYITRVPSEEDRRESRLVVGEKFFSYYGNRTQIIADAARVLRRDFSESELQTFEKMLAALNDTVE